MSRTFGSPRNLALFIALGLAACARDGSPLSPNGPSAAPQIASLTCTADLRSKSVTCGKVGSADGASGNLLVGNQGVYVNLASSNVQVVADTFQFDATVQNLIPQSLGTTDGSTLDPAGVRVFFNNGPTATVGAGPVTVANPDGTGTFTAVNQPYFQYDQVLAQGQTSNAKTWKIQFDPGVTSFAFKVYVAAEVQYPAGYVRVTNTAPHVLSGGTVSLVDSVFTVVGTYVDTASVTWGTSNPAIATVDGSGVVTALAPGNVQISVTSGSRSGVAKIAVCPNLAVGGVYVASMPEAAAACFGGGGAAEEFTYMPINLSTSSSLSLTVTGAGIQAVTGPPTPNLIPSNVSGLRSLDQSLQIASDVPMLERDARELSPKLASLRNRVRGTSSGPRGFRPNIVPGVVPTVGSLIDINTNSACSGSPSVRTGMVRSVSQHLIILGDTANPAGGFTTAQYDSIALEFDTIAWPVDSANFGAPTDIDTNGHVVAFFTRAVNELSPPASSSVTLGFFASKDVFGTNDCSNSNGSADDGSEIFYMLVPDPTGAVNSNVRTVSFVRGNTTGTLGHEFQHMINGFRRAYVTGASFFEQGYLNEGLSHIAEELMFYRASVGLTSRQNIVLSTLTTGPNASRRVAAFNTYANQNFGRFRGWLQRPDTAGAFRPNANSLAVRGAIWAFLRYAADRVNGNDQTFFYNLVNSNLEGTANIQNAIGGAAPNTWLRDFTAAMYADDNAFTVASDYQNPSWNFRSVFGGLGGFPLLARPLTNNTGLTLSYATGGGTAYTRFGVAASGFADLTALSGGVAPTSPYSLIVVRTK